MATKSVGRLLNKICVITGGGSGYGEGIARRFAQEGAKVIVADFNETSGQKVVQNIKDSQQSAIFMNLDVAKRQDWQKLSDFAKAEFGGIDVLVNNAGTSYKNKPTFEVTETDFDNCFNVNVKSIFHSTQILIPEMIDRGKGGSIINIASIGATRPRPGLVWYNSSKGAVWNATKGLASEYGKYQIRINSVCPLLGATGLFEHFSGLPNTPENQAKFIDNVPLGRLCEATDVADYCLFLASDESRFITGTNLEIDGGKGI